MHFSNWLHLLKALFSKACTYKEYKRTKGLTLWKITAYTTPISRLNLVLKHRSNNCAIKKKKRKTEWESTKKVKISCQRLFASRKFNRFSLNRVNYQIGTGMQAKSRVSHNKLISQLQPRLNVEALLVYINSRGTERVCVLSYEYSSWFEATLESERVPAANWWLATIMKRSLLFCLRQSMTHPSRSE